MFTRFEKDILLKPKLQKNIEMKPNCDSKTLYYKITEESETLRGTLPLVLEAGRFKNIQEDNGLCELCKLEDDARISKSLKFNVLVH